ncbi:MAG: isochorismatase family protein [Xanthomonadales bacterium]|nr:isochorismatase family protein [Xanthomonadales bacterium]
MNVVKIRSGDALVIVDVQNDFARPDGALSVPDGMAVLEPLNLCIERFRAAGAPVYATRDWHPANHCSFADQGGPWPPHCVAQSPGAAFVSELDLPPTTRIISKAAGADEEAYSGFSGTDLADQLRHAGVQRLVVGGLATDYCVLQTVLDALGHEFDVLLLVDAIRAVNVNPGDGDQAVREMTEAGAQPVTSDLIT